MRVWIWILAVGTFIIASPLLAKEDADSDEASHWEVNASYPIKIIINIPERILTLFHGDDLIFEFPVAVGAASFKTPIGERALNQITWNPWWHPPKSEWAEGEEPAPPGPHNPLGPVKMSLGKTILLHGTNKESSVGRPASHGCMRMLNQHAKEMAWWIQSHFTDQADPLLFDAYQQNRSKTAAVPLSSPIPVEIRYDVFEIEDSMLKIHPDVYGRVGNRHQKIMDWLKTQGYLADEIDGEALKLALDNSTAKSVMLSLDQLAPSRYNYSKKKKDGPPGEIDAANRANSIRLKEQQGKVKLSSLMKFH